MTSAAGMPGAPNVSPDNWSFAATYSVSAPPSEWPVTNTLLRVMPCLAAALITFSAKLAAPKLLLM